MTALHDMGGIGKTVLAKALTDDPVVQRAFPDGIVWITAGKERERDFVEEMREVAKALGDDVSAYDTVVRLRESTWMEVLLTCAASRTSCPSCPFTTSEFVIVHGF